MYATTTTTLVVPFTDEVGSPHWQRKMEMLTECETTNYVDLTTANSCEMLLRACRISCLDEKEMYFEPRETWVKVILGDKGERIAFEQQQQQQQQENSPPTTSNNNKTFFVSPRNETSAHAMAQTLLMPANENECNNNNSNSSEEYPLPPLELRQRVLEQLRSIRVQTLEKDAKDFEDIERARRQGIPTSTSASVVCKIETEGYAVALTKWAALQGKDANVSKVAPCLLSSMNDARGLCATEDIRAGENILEIPRRMLLDAGTICISEQGPFGDLLRILERCGADTIMTLWIMKERMKMKTKQETFWSLYFLSLPDGSQKLTPLSWPEDIVRVGLGNTPIFETVMHERQKVRNGYDALLPSLLANCPESFEGNQEEFWSYDQYISALELWMSYAMTVKPVHNSDSGTIDVLSPVAFFCNHGIYPHCVHYSQLRLSDECLVFPAMRDIEKNEEIMLSYGAKSNGELLLFYGFCIDDNPYDSIDITLDFDSLNGVEKPEVRKRREELLVKHDLTLNHAIRKNAELPIDLIATIRILCCEKELVFLYDGDPKAREISMLSESKASDALFTALSAIRSSMSSTDAIEHRAPEEWRAANQHYLNECKKYIRGLFQVIDVALEQVSMWRQTSSLAAKKLGKRTHRDFL